MFRLLWTQPTVCCIVKSIMVQYINRLFAPFALKEGWRRKKDYDGTRSIVVVLCTCSVWMNCVEFWPTSNDAYEQANQLETIVKLCRATKQNDGLMTRGYTAHRGEKSIINMHVTDEDMNEQRRWHCCCCCCCKSFHQHVVTPSVHPFVDVYIGLVT